MSNSSLKYYVLYYINSFLMQEHLEMFQIHLNILMNMQKIIL